MGIRGTNVQEALLHIIVALLHAFGLVRQLLFRIGRKLAPFGEGLLLRTALDPQREQPVIGFHV